MASSPSHSITNNFQWSIEISEYMSLLFRHQLALKSNIESSPPELIPPQHISEELDSECQKAAQYLVSAFLNPSEYFFIPLLDF